MESDRGASAVRAAGNHVYIIEKWIDLAAVGGRKSRFVMGDGHNSATKTRLRKIKIKFDKFDKGFRATSRSSLNTTVKKRNEN